MNTEPEYVDVLPLGWHDDTLSPAQQRALIRSGAIPTAAVRERLALRVGLLTAAVVVPALTTATVFLRMS